MRYVGERGLGARDLYRGILLLALLGVVGYFFRDVLRFLTLSLIAVLMALALSAGAGLLGRLRLPRTAGVLLTLLLFAGVLGALLYALLPPLIDQLVGFLASLPDILASVGEQMRPEGRGGGSPVVADPLARLERRITDVVSSLTFDPLAVVGNVFDFGVAVVGVAAVLVVLVVAAVYMAAKPEPLVQGFLALFPARARGRAREVLHDLRATLGRWLGGTAVAMVAVGSMMSLALWVLGVPFPLLFGVLAGLFEIVPFFGPVLVSVPIVLIALSESWVHALVVLGAIVVIQQVESNLLIPLIMGRAIRLHPAVIALGILFVGWTFGVLAIFIAVPILATARVLIQNLWVERIDDGEHRHAGPPKAEDRPDGAAGASRG